MTHKAFDDWQVSSHLSGQSAAYIDGLYEIYLQNPTDLPAMWQDYFNQLPRDDADRPDVSHEQIRQAFLALAKAGGRVSHRPGATPTDAEKKQGHALQLINAYRLHGHHEAALDPLSQAKRLKVPDLELSHYGFTDADLNTTFSSESPLTQNGATLSTIFSALKRTYADTVGVEYMHITNQNEITWLQQQLESVQSHPTLSPQRKKSLLSDLTAAEGLEKYLGSRYVGQKRFSLEGGDSLIPLMRELIETAGQHEVKELIIGMAHRGRLNVLVNILGKSPQDLFQEFEGKSQGDISGDVKYHLGYSSDVPTSKGPLHLALAFNPSHLEIISPVVEGSVRARQRRRSDVATKNQVVPLLIHGDAAFAGQGVVMETFNFSQARGYSTGGSIHLVINNQIGFTTSNPLDARSTLYCTDIAKMVQAPIFHVNSDDPEAVIFIAKLAMDYRMKFKKDVVIDLVCYRRHGHNEADEPAVTQPTMYSAIRKLPTTRKIYAERLMKEAVMTQSEVQQLVDNYRDKLDKGESLVETLGEKANEAYEKYAVDWSPYFNQPWTVKANTALPIKKIQQLAKKIDTLPKDFTPHPVLKRLWQERQKMTAGEIPMNWGYAELLAYASLVDAGILVRISGQDVGRGTFAHRHANLYDYKTGEVYSPLQHISKNQKEFVIIDSILSEEAVLGFEYGFATAEPNALVVWEAQFGDFANGAQVVIDQFISSGEQKWGRLCGLVMLLPHGYEGQGPEHSSARLERFMQLCAQENMQVCVPSTPAQIFHLLRRQAVRPYRKPLIVMSPKSLLRHKLAVSPLSALTSGAFHPVIPEVDKLPAKQVKKVVLCSGKVYYDLLEARRKQQQTHVALIRIEQLYPFPAKDLKGILSQYKQAKSVAWCQEEPKNQGAWHATQAAIAKTLAAGQTLSYVGRGYFAAPAMGSAGAHHAQQKALVEEALS